MDKLENRPWTKLEGAGGGGVGDESAPVLPGRRLLEFQLGIWREGKKVRTSEMTQRFEREDDNASKLIKIKSFIANRHEHLSYFVN